MILCWVEILFLIITQIDLNDIDFLVDASLINARMNLLKRAFGYLIYFEAQNEIIFAVFVFQIVTTMYTIKIKFLRFRLRGISRFIEYL